jgi:mitochondrial fission protein ELM1
MTPRCWIITDGKQGMESQCVGLAERLGLDPLIKRVCMRFPWRQLSPWPLMIGNRWALSKQGDGLDGPLPDLLIATGRHSVAASLAVRNLSHDQTFRVQIQAPGIAAGNFHLVVVPRHDKLRGDNVLTSAGALHRITDATLAAAREKFAGRLARFPAPRIAVLVGGSNGIYSLTFEAVERLAGQLATAVKQAGGSLLLTPSRRTGAQNEAVLRAGLADVPGEIWDGTNENPFLGYLAYADHIVVTSDSVNMVTEASATGKPVHVVDLAGGSAKFDRFHRLMREAGITRPYNGQLDTWTYTPPDDTGTVAAEIRRQMGLRGFTW